MANNINVPKRNDPTFCTDLLTCVFDDKKNKSENRNFFRVFFVVSYFSDFVIENLFLPVCPGWEIG